MLVAVVGLLRAGVEPPQEPNTEQRFDLPTVPPTVQQATLTGLLASPGPDDRPKTQDLQLQPPPDVLADVGGRPVELHRSPIRHQPRRPPDS